MPNILKDADRRCRRGKITGCGRYLLPDGTCPNGCPQGNNRGGKGRAGAHADAVVRKPDTSPPISDADDRRLSTTLAANGIPRGSRRPFALPQRGRACVNGCGVRGKRCPACILADPMAQLHQREMARASLGIERAGSEAAKRCKVYSAEECARLQAEMAPRKKGAGR
jgi:hypothetical protein